MQLLEVTININYCHDTHANVIVGVTETIQGTQSKHNTILSITAQIYDLCSCSRHKPWLQLDISSSYPAKTHFCVMLTYSRAETQNDHHRHIAFFSPKKCQVKW